MAKLSTYEKHYKDLSEMWHYAYDDQIKVSEAMMIIYGCIVEMHSDIIQFEIKNGSEKTKKSKKRLEVIQENIQKIASVQSDNYILKLHNKRLADRNFKLESKLNEINQQNINATKI